MRPHSHCPRRRFSSLAFGNDLNAGALAHTSRSIRQCRTADIHNNLRRKRLTSEGRGVGERGASVGESDWVHEHVICGTGARWAIPEYVHSV